MQNNINTPNKKVDLDHPLSMTVYDLPSPQEAAHEDSKRTSKGRLLMIAVFLTCAAPVVLSYLTYYVIRPTTIKSYGELIQPTRSIPDLQVQVLARPNSEKPLLHDKLSELKGQWLLMSLSSGICNEACEKTLYFQRQIHTALGREKDRVDRVWLVLGEGSVAPELVKAVGDSWIIKASEKDVSTWFEMQAIEKNMTPNAAKIQEFLYLVDPMGELMMKFPSTGEIDTAPKIRRDIERLLRASESWDLAGRNALPAQPKLNNPTTDLPKSDIEKK